MADIIDFPKGKLTEDEKKKFIDFINEELADVQDTSIKSIEEIQGEINVLAEYFRKFMDVLDNPYLEIHPDWDFGLLLMERRIKKIRGMLKSLFEE